MHTESFSEERKQLGDSTCSFDGILPVIIFGHSSQYRDVNTAFLFMIYVIWLLLWFLMLCGGFVEGLGALGPWGQFVAIFMNVINLTGEVVPSQNYGSMPGHSYSPGVRHCVTVHSNMRILSDLMWSNFLGSLEKRQNIHVFNERVVTSQLVIGTKTISSKMWNPPP